MTSMLQKLKCYLGFHDWQDTGIRRIYGLIGFFECSHCKRDTQFCIGDFDLTEQYGNFIIVYKRKPK